MGLLLLAPAATRLVTCDRCSPVRPPGRSLPACCPDVTGSGAVSPPLSLHLPLDSVHAGASGVPVQGEHCTASPERWASGPAWGMLTLPSLGFLIHEMGMETVLLS